MTDDPRWKAVKAHIAKHDAAAGDVNTTPAATAQRPSDHSAPRGDDDGL
jgi:hypothetical protein